MVQLPEVKRIHDLVDHEILDCYDCFSGGGGGSIAGVSGGKVSGADGPS